jgi:orotate phosphoribosyltransferase
MISENGVIELFEKHKALLKGHFLLSSGRHSGKYLQCALLLQNPDVSELLCRNLAEKLGSRKPDFIIGPALGGILVSYEVARHMKVRSLFAERENNEMTLRRGFSIKPGEKCVIVEDVVTTGKSTLEVKKVLDSMGAVTLCAAALIDRSGGANLGFELVSLAKVEVESYPAQECPLCKNGIPLVKPGSRNNPV